MAPAKAPTEAPETPRTDTFTFALDDGSDAVACTDTDSAVMITINREGTNDGGAVSVKVSTRDGSAKAGEHYVATEETLVFEHDGDTTTASFYVALLDTTAGGTYEDNDGTPRSREFTCVMELDANAGDNAGTRTVTVRIANTFPGTFSLGRGDYAFAHPRLRWGGESWIQSWLRCLGGGGNIIKAAAYGAPATVDTITVTVVRSHGRYGAVRARVATRDLAEGNVVVDGGAVAGRDYGAVETVLEFADDETGTKSVELPILARATPVHEASMRRFEVAMNVDAADAGARYGAHRAASVAIAAVAKTGFAHELLRRVLHNLWCRLPIALVMLCVSAVYLATAHRVVSTKALAILRDEMYEKVTLTVGEVSYARSYTCTKIHGCDEGSCQNITATHPVCDSASSVEGEWACFREDDCCAVPLGPCGETCAAENEHHHHPHNPHGHDPHVHYPHHHDPDMGYDFDRRRRTGTGTGSRIADLIGRILARARPVPDGREGLQARISLRAQRSLREDPEEEFMDNGERRALLRRLATVSASKTTSPQQIADDEDPPGVWPLRALSHAQGTCSKNCTCPPDQYLTSTSFTWRCSKGAVPSSAPSRSPSASPSTEAAGGRRRLTHRENMCSRTCNCTQPGGTLCTSTSGTCSDQLKSSVAVSFTASAGGGGTRLLSGTVPQTDSAQAACGWNDDACVASARGIGDEVAAVFLKAAANGGESGVVPPEFNNLQVLILGADADPLTPMKSDDPDENYRLYGGEPEDWRLFGDKLRPGVGPFFRAQQYFVASTVCWVFLAIMLQAHCLCLNCWDEDHNVVGAGGGTTTYWVFWGSAWLLDVASWMCFYTGVNFLATDPDRVGQCFADGVCDATRPTAPTPAPAPGCAGCGAGTVIVPSKLLVIATVISVMMLTNKR